MLADILRMRDEQKTLSEMVLPMMPIKMMKNQPYLHSHENFLLWCAYVASWKNTYLLIAYLIHSPSLPDANQDDERRDEAVDVAAAV